jgi:hypothetical protein
MTTGSTTSKRARWLFWGILLGVCVVVIGIHAGANPLLGKWFIDPSSADFVPGGGEQSLAKGIDFKEAGRFITFGYNFTLRGSYSLVATNRVRLESKEISGTFKGKQVTNSISLPKEFTTRFYKYDEARQVLVEEGAMITPFRFTRTAPK